MSARLFGITLAGLLTNLILIFSVLTPLTSTQHPYWTLFAEPPARVELAIRGGMILPPVTAGRAILSCGLYDPFYILGTWRPTTEQVAALEKELPVYFGVHGGFGADVDTLVRAAATTPRQYVGISHLLEGDLVLATGFDPEGPERPAGRFIDRCNDSAWRWMATFSPHSGRFVRLSLTRGAEW